VFQQKVKTFEHENHFTKIYKDPRGVYKKKQQYRVYPESRCGLLQDKITLNQVLSQMFVYKPRKYQPLWTYKRRGPLLYGVVTKAVWACTG